MINTNTDIILSCKSETGEEVRLTGKDAVCTEFKVDMPSPNFGIANKNTIDTIKELSARPPVEITMTFLCRSEDFLHEMFDGDYKPKRRISQLRVDDCSVEELLFAIRKKIK